MQAHSSSSLTCPSSYDGHPLGILPLGNIFLETEVSILQMRRKGLGALHVLSDEIVLLCLSFTSYQGLIQISMSSKACYVYSNIDELWRDLTLSEFISKSIQFANNWKLTFINMMMTNRHSEFYSLSKQKLFRGIFSNDLFRTWTCSTFDYETECPGFMLHSDIDVVSSNNLSIEDFILNYEVPNIPVVIKDAVSNWTSFDKWTNDYLSKNCGNFLFRATSGAAPLGAQFTMQDYLQYCNSCCEEAPLYLFERDFSKCPANLDDDYSVPKYFDSNINKQTDLFKVFGNNCRPDYKWLITGPRRSGSIFHIDPNQTNAWNVCIKGRKKWIFYHPSINPPGIVTSSDGADVTIPISIGEWLLTFWKFHLDARNNINPKFRPLEIIVEPGDVIFVPHGYWHMVVNLDDCIALTHNYVSSSNIVDVLRFLREKQDQISGVRDRDESIKPDEMYDIFLHHLVKEEIFDESYVEELVQKSLPIKTNKINIFEKQKKRKRNKSNDEYFFKFDFQ